MRCEKFEKCEKCEKFEKCEKCERFGGDVDARCVGRASSPCQIENQSFHQPGRGRPGHVTDTSGKVRLESFDLVVDAIDSVDCKAQLLLDATSAHVPVVSSMGAALRTDPTQVRVMRFDKVQGDGLAKALRQRFKKLQRFPATKFPCVWSGEPPIQTTRQQDNQTIPKGSVMTETATFGMCLASEALAILTKGGQ